MRIPLHLDPRDDTAGARVQRMKLHMVMATIAQNRGWMTPRKVGNGVKGTSVISLSQRQMRRQWPGRKRQLTGIR